MRSRLYLTALLAVAALWACEPEEPEQNQGQQENLKLETPKLTVTPFGEMSFTVSWDAVEHADYYTYRINGTGERTTEETQVSYTDLSAGEYLVEVRAEANEGSRYRNSAWGSVTYTLEIDPAEIPEGWDVWLGKWTITTDSTLVWQENDEGLVLPVLLPEPKEMQVEITYDGSTGEPILLMTGWSDYTDNVSGMTPPVWCQVDEETDQLVLLNGIQIGTLPTGTLNWYAYCGDQGTLDAVWAYCVTLNGDEAKGEAAVILWDYGPIQESQVRAFDVFTITNAGGFLPINDESPAGDFVMVRNSGSEEASR
ncbi:MAG TPA: hypothetical protein IAC03_01735 [Candidatus Coprenecus pullistercoris]|nr:hypothetical protein [Candidatus Coprenecus pullistercoris]